jgi:hypothetical protein
LTLEVLSPRLGQIDSGPRAITLPMLPLARPKRLLSRLAAGLSGGRQISPDTRGPRKSRQSFLCA